MMSSYGVTARNFAGGALGGLLGILAFGKISEAALPFGVVFGVLLGWHPEVLAAKIMESFYAILGSPHTIPRLLRLALRRLRMHFRAAVRRSKKTLAWTLAQVGRFLRWVADPIVRPYRWLRKCRARRWVVMHRTITGVGAALSFWFIALPLGTFLSPYWFPGDHRPIEALFCTTIIVTFATVGFPMMFAQMYYMFSQQKGYAFYCEHTLLLSILRETGIVAVIHAIVIGSIACGLATIALVVCASIVIVMPLGAVVLAYSLAVGTLKGAHFAVTRGGRLCLYATLATTVIVAVWASPYIPDAQVLWSSALIAGLVSGAVTEVLQKTLTAAFRLRWLQLLALTPLLQQLRVAFSVLEQKKA